MLLSDKTCKNLAYSGICSVNGKTGHCDSGACTVG